MNVSIIGAGYVGLITGTCLSAQGHRVQLVDLDVAKVAAINAGTPPIHEAGLPELLRAQVGSGALSATSDLASAVRASELTLIAVGTPFDGHAIDLTSIRDAATQIGQALRGQPDYHVVAVKSTVVPGTTDEVVGPILATESGRQLGRDLGLGMNPEFLTEGQALADFLRPDRIVLGGCGGRTHEALARLYGAFTQCPILRTSNKAAEMIKYASNALLATMISFANEIGNLCSGLGGVDVLEVMQGVHGSNYLSPFLEDGRRIAAPITSFLMAGCGFGGSCLPKDVKALVSHGEQRGVPMPLLESVIQINQEQPRRVLELLNRHFSTLRGVRTAILGLAFKPDTDDLRESPAFPIIDSLLAEGAVIRAYDPVAGDAARRLLADKPVRICHGLGEVVENAEAVVLVTRWDEFRRLPALLEPMSPAPLFVDGRRMLEPTHFRRYEGIGV
ncbi:MAG TPA: UDP-glucose/GDP-mannose dehydrogenase family protein [Pirellulales bacterium]|jgi:UDPglucose 6-dehydrogenase/GDP-mannose 6-dehydrogenase|nr:UDP-glucose/GDP-mannose dehydrogenase family protein [Pirellulales bacterium]